ncbi:hypothetical protein BDD12DRAFT_886083 [Trichophaea hybrida]|nr:hypothetical protein BDD12DRAFT_886083 [Trichophaea hybrida]
MKLYRKYLFSAILIVSLLSAAAHKIPSSPSSYPRIATSTEASAFRTTVDIPPTRIPELLKRQVSDSLGWNNPSTCNVGICPSTRSCIVFTSDGIRATTVTGMCCNIGGNCPSMHACLPYSNHTMPMSTDSNYMVISGTQYCGSTYPYCYSSFYEYGWGLGTFLALGCQNSYSELITTRNPSWYLYATEANPAKGPMPTITTDTMRNKEKSLTIVESESLRSTNVQTASPPVPVKRDHLPIGPIAGIVIGSIVAIGLCAVGIMVLLSKLRRADQAQGGIAPFQSKEPISPTFVYDNGAHQSATYPSPQQPVSPVRY